jgi:heme oxygenase
MSLSQKLRTETKDLHFLDNQILDLILVKRRMMVDTYGVYLGAYYHVYKALEECLEKAESDPVLHSVHRPAELNRLGGLAADLEFFLGESWSSKIRSLPTVSRYVEHLKEIAEERPELLLAHCYVRYMGDLARCQLMRIIVQRLYRLPNDDQTGVQFFNFNQIVDLNGFKASYKSRMDELDLNEILQKEIIEEAKWVFQSNIDILKEIDGTEPSRGIFLDNHVERACSMLIDGATDFPQRSISQLGRSASLRIPPRSSMAVDSAQSGGPGGILREPLVDGSGNIVPPQIQRLKRGHSVFHRRSLAMVGLSLAASTFSPWSPQDNRPQTNNSVV